MIVHRDLLGHTYRLPAASDVVRLSDGSFYNTKLRAPSVWEIDIEPSHVGEAAELFYGPAGDAGPFSRVGEMVEPYEEFKSKAGTFFAQRVVGWDSDIAWVSVDDAQSFVAFEELFHRMRIPQRFTGAMAARARSPHHAW